MRLAFHIVNVFTRGGALLSGNPLCVVEAPTGLGPELMQEIARQFNLSETTFIAPASGASAAVRIFTPQYEMPFAGHPTLGTAHVVRRLQGGERLTLSMPAGVIAVEAEGDRWTLSANAHTRRAFDGRAADLAAALGLEPADLGTPVLWVDSGTEQLIVPLVSEEAALRAEPRAPALKRFVNRQGRSQALVFAPLGDAGPDAGARDAAAMLRARFFFEAGAGFSEDPATGSACANLGGWLIATGAKLPLRRVIWQGDAVLRPSTLLLAVERDARVRVGGDVAYVGGGQLEL